MSWKPEVIADSSGKWCDNALRFATEEEAKSYVDRLAWNWMAVRETRVVECEDKVTHKWANNVAELVTEPYDPEDKFDDMVGDESDDDLFERHYEEDSNNEPEFDPDFDLPEPDPEHQEK